MHESQGRSPRLPIWGFPDPVTSHAEHQVPSSSQVQDEVAGQQLVGLRSIVGRARQPLDLAVAERDRAVECQAFGASRRAAQILGPSDRDGAHAEDFLRSLFDLMGLVLDVSDHTTLSRRTKQLKVPLRVPKKLGRIDLVIDSSGLGVDGDGVIVGQRLTDASVDDGNVGVGVGVDFVDSALGKVRRVIGDGAYDSRALYDAAVSRGARGVVPPIKTAQTGGRGCQARDRIVRRIRKVGRRQWKQESGYHQQARAENTFMRYRKILGDRLHARDADGQSVEARLACSILNRMTELGMPASYAVRM